MNKMFSGLGVKNYGIEYQPFYANGGGDLVEKRSHHE